MIESVQSPGDWTTRCFALFLTLLLLLALVSTAQAAAKDSRRTRADVLEALAAAEATFADRPNDSQARQELAQLLFEAGNFWRAAEVIQPVTNNPQTAPEAVLLAADLAYLLGRYDESEELYRRVLAGSKAIEPTRIKATVGLALGYYQSNRFDAIAKLDIPRGVQIPGAKLIRQFDGRPYRVSWSGQQRAVEAPFLVTDPLPLLTVEYNGRPVHVLFDTGADICIVDSELAKELGMQESSWSIGSFGGGKLGRIGFGKLDSVKIGDVVLENVPAMTLPTRRFSPGFADGKFPIGGIIGTGLARQFLTTVDYQHGKLVLRERSPQAAEQLRGQLADRLAAEVPFVLSGTHWMMARGSLDDRDGLTFFVDSGLASGAFTAPPQTLKYVGIPEPEKKIDPKSVGGGGGKYATGKFDIKSLGLGPLRQHDLVGEFGSRPASSYWQSGCITDGLISHAFLRKYASWTIDFDSMTYVFAEPSKK